MAVTLNGTTGLVFNDGSSQNTAATGFGFKNRIINGSFVIDQRNAGASTSPSDGTYFVDRWRSVASQTSKFTTQQTPSATETGFATRVGAGFTSYLACTSSSAYTVGASEKFVIGQLIEGYNWADMAWGTANAKTVTLSFLVYASAAGTYGGSLQNTAGDYSYVFSYSVASANTWTSISVTIAGPTAGTFAQLTNGSAMRVWFSLGAGATSSTTAGSWNAATYWQPTGATNMVSTSGAYLYFTGVQLEKGSTATSFDYRPYGTELALCQRYFCKTFPLGTAPGNDVTIAGAFRGTAVTINASSQIEPAGTWKFPVSMRTTPSTITLYAPGTSGHTAGQWTNDGNAGSSANARTNFAGTESTSFDNTGVLVSAGFRPIIHATADAEL